MLYPVLQDPLRPVVSSLFDRPRGASIGQMLFGAGEQGGWYDVSDMSTLFQDSAGTTPVTAVEQPVGRMLDKSGRGNHATQSTTTKRPVLSRRVNELLATTTLSTQSVTTRAASYRLVFSGAGSVTLSGTASGVYGAGTHSITCTAGGLTLTVSGTVQDASLTLAIDAHLPYQWVNTTTDYDADPSKFPAYLRFDGVDDALQTGNIDFTSTDKMTVWAGITKLTDVSTQTIAELSANKNANNGVFALFCPFSNLSRTYWYSKGTTESQAVALVTAGAASLVITGIGDVAGDVSRLRLNGSTAIANTDQGPGNYGNYPLYIGSRAGTSLFLNCRLYSLIVRGAQSSLSQIEATELYIKQKMRMP